MNRLASPQFAYRFDPAAYAARQPADTWPLLSRITAPTLVVRGERGLILPRDMAERLRDAVPGARLVEVAEAYHHLVLDRPSVFATALFDFLEPVESTTDASAAQAADERSRGLDGPPCASSAAGGVWGRSSAPPQPE